MGKKKIFYKIKFFTLFRILFFHIRSTKLKKKGKKLCVKE